MKPCGGGDETFSVTSDGRTIASIRSSWTLAPEVWAGPVDRFSLSSPIASPHANDALKPMWGRAETVRWKSDDVFIQGWLLYPANYDETKKYPLVVSVHGGPAAAKKPAWPGAFDMTLLSSQGYASRTVPQSAWEFQEMARLSRRPTSATSARATCGTSCSAWTKSAAHCPSTDRASASPDGSYGGYMTMWTVTQTKRFRAAVAGAGISNWQSYYGQNLIDQWMIPYFGASVYDNPTVYARASPINFIRNVVTPTLMLVGDSDAECPGAAVVRILACPEIARRAKPSLWSIRAKAMPSASRSMLRMSSRAPSGGSTRTSHRNLPRPKTDTLLAMRALPNLLWIACCALPVFAQNHDAFNKPFPAFKIIGNIYYVGTDDLGSYPTDYHLRRKHS